MANHFFFLQYPKVRTVTATSLVTALQDYSAELIERKVIPSEEALETLMEVSLAIHQIANYFPIWYSNFRN